MYRANGNDIYYISNNCEFIIHSKKPVIHSIANMKKTFMATFRHTSKSADKHKETSSKRR